MSIENSILGLLSWKPATGYELKKIFEESSILYWSGNNNQIYKALSALLDEGFVTYEVQHRDGAPSRKVYTITEEGMMELNKWVMSAPEAPEFRKPFLTQLAWAGALKEHELDSLLAGYEKELMIQLLMEQEKKRRRGSSQGRTALEEFLWNSITDNIVSSYKHELSWVQQLRNNLSHIDKVKDMNNMKYEIVEKNHIKVLEVFSAEAPIRTEQDALDLIALCGEHDSSLLLLHAAVFSDDFFRLRTGLAGAVMQKFVNYGIKAAAVIPADLANRGKFKDMMLETNRGPVFRIYYNRDEAENWLVGSM